jgi:hypothetical protein
MTKSRRMALLSLAQLYDISDFSPNTIRQLSERIALTSAPEHLLYREAELDDLWRQVVTALDDARDHDDDLVSVAYLTKLLQVVHDAHDPLSVRLK